jgi:hypothetical protein
VLVGRKNVLSRPLRKEQPGSDSEGRSRGESAMSDVKLKNLLQAENTICNCVVRPWRI